MAMALLYPQRLIERKLIERKRCGGPFLCIQVYATILDLKQETIE